MAILLALIKINQSEIKIEENSLNVFVCNKVIELRKSATSYCEALPLPA
jgi:hypothetical protein